MSSRSPRHSLSTVGLVFLAIVAAVLSVAALSQNRTAVPVIATPSATGGGAPATLKNPQESITQNGPTPVHASTEGESKSPPGSPTVVVIGDRYSSAAAPNVWVHTVADDLGWGLVVNLSTPGRGYVKKPSSCDFSVCSNFAGSNALVAAENPDVVLTFGGTEDGDYDLSGAAMEYFKALRAALPDVELIAISPVTSENEAAYWLGMHSDTIRAGADAVNATFIDVGQPGVGDGNQLSAAAQDNLARVITNELS